MANILLLHPMRDLRSYIPYALLHLESHLKRKGHTVTIIDFQLGKQAQNDFKAAVKARPDILGISVFLGPGMKMAKAAAAYCRQESPDTRIVFGGVLPSTYPEYVLNRLPADYIVRFEGEESFTALVEAIERGETRPGIPGIGWKDGSDIVLQPRGDVLDLSQALPIEFSGTSNEGYVIKGAYYMPSKRAASFFSSRGCPYSCAFCYNQYYNMKKWRPFPVDWVIDGVEKLVTAFHIDALYFLDDNFAVDPLRAKQILQGIKARGLDLTYWWEMRIDQILRMGVSELREFYDLGLRYLYVGVESASNRLLDIIDKGFTVEETRQANQMLAQAGIRSYYSLIIGIPTETRDETLRTSDLALELINSNPLASIWHLSNFVIYPGTPIHDKVKSEVGVDLWQNKNPFIEPDDVPWVNSSNRMRRSISHCSIFLRNNVILKDMPFLGRMFFTVFRRISIFRMKYHLFVPGIDTLIVTIISRLQHRFSRGKLDWQYKIFPK